MFKLTQLTCVITIPFLWGCSDAQRATIKSEASSEQTATESDDSVVKVQHSSSATHEAQAAPAIDFSGLQPREKLDRIVSEIQTAFAADPILKPLLSMETKREEIDVIGVNLAWQQLQPRVQTMLTNAFKIEDGAWILFHGPQSWRSTNPVLYLAMLHVQKRFEENVPIEASRWGPMTFVPPQLDRRFLINGEIGQVDFKKVQAELMATALNAGLQVDQEYQPDVTRSGCEIRTAWSDTVLDDTKPSAPRSYKWRIIMHATKAVEQTYGQWEMLGGIAERMQLVSEFQALLSDGTITANRGPLHLTAIGLIPEKEAYKAKGNYATVEATQAEILEKLDGFQLNSGTMTLAEFLDLSTIFKETLTGTHEILEQTLTNPAG